MGTHLYGRRLVVEWAENEEGLDELRDKTASKFEKDAAPVKARVLSGGRLRNPQSDYAALPSLSCLSRLQTCCLFCKVW